MFIYTIYNAVKKHIKLSAKFPKRKSDDKIFNVNVLCLYEHFFFYNPLFILG